MELEVLASSGQLFTGQEQGTFAAAVGWITGTLLGSVATALCTIAIALVGFSMMSGHLRIKQGARIILGCFLLLGAPVIASAIGGLRYAGNPPPPQPAAIVETPDPRGDLPPADYDPYAGASLRRN